MLHIGAGHTNNSQIIVKLFGYDIFCNDLQLWNPENYTLALSSIIRFSTAPVYSCSAK